ncbi:MAG: SdrD B-like domain-containing protein [Coriobacteriia bacterium]|jgi:uncharacterized repeat protein (TIGR01451 family)|nr:SdrD B-like domain-containing protein [Coriobacteriia bacterium]
MSEMAKTLRRKTVLSRLFTTYLTLVIVVMFTGVAGATPVSVAEENTPELTGEVVASGEDLDQQAEPPAEAPVDEGAAPVEEGAPAASQGEMQPLTAPASGALGAAAPATAGKEGTTGNSKIVVVKFNDLNGNGKKDSGEPTLSGWEITLKDSKSKVVATKTTDSKGEAVFDRLAAGTYYVSETLKSGWESTTAQPVKVVLGTCCTQTINIGNREVIPPQPSLKIDKSTTTLNYSALGDVINYSYKVTNNGNVVLSAPWTVVDDKVINPIDVTGAPATLAPGDHFIVTASYAVTQDDLNAGSVTNLAYATGMYGVQLVSSPDDSAVVLGIRLPALSLLKAASPGTYDAVGDVITYTYTLTNTGNVVLSGPFSVDDDKATVVPDDPALMALAPGASATFTASYVIDQADLDDGSVTNTAQGHGHFGEGAIDSNFDDKTVYAEQDPQIDIVKLTNGEDGLLIAAGAEVTWSYLVTNTGNVTLRSVVVTDDVIGEIGTIESLAPGASETLYAHGIAVAGSYENIGTAFGVPPVSEGGVWASDDSSYFGADPAISIEKYVDQDLVLEGDSVTYTFVVRNTGNVPLYEVTVVDDHLGTIAEVEMVAVGAELTFTKTAAIFEPTTNIVVAKGTDGVGQEVSDSAEAFVDIDEALEFPPDLMVKKSANRETANPGDVITYTVVIKNVGGAVATEYTVKDTFDKDHLSVVDAAGGTVAGNTITWTFPGPLASGESQTITYKMMVSKTMPAGRTVVPNKVVVTMAGDEDATNNNSGWSITVNVKPEKEEPYLPFTGANLLGLLALAGVTGIAGAQLRRRGRKA